MKKIILILVVLINYCQAQTTWYCSTTSIPIFAVTPATSTIGVMESAVLTASGATTYSWSTGETTAVITVTPTTLTTYTCTGTWQASYNTAKSIISVTGDTIGWNVFAWYTSINYHTYGADTTNADTLYDISGFLRHAGRSPHGIVKTYNQLNGYPSMYFTKSPGRVFAFPTFTQSTYSIYYVIKTVAGVNDVLGTNSAGKLFTGSPNANSFGVNGSSLNYYTLANPNVYNIIEVLDNGSTNYCWEKGVSLGTGTTSSMVLTRLGGESNYGKFYLVEIIICKGKHNDTTRGFVETYLMDKYFP